MGTEIKLWQVGKSGVSSLRSSHPTSEADLEKWIYETPEILGEDLLVIGQQKSLPGVGRFDLLAIDVDSRIVVIELKKGISPREVIAQALDYASWLDTTTETEIRALAKQFLGKDLDQAFLEEFDTELNDIDTHDHRILIVAASLDNCTERIVNYLSERHSIDINALLFTYCELPSGECVLARTALVPEKIRVIKKSDYTDITDDEILVLAQKRNVAQMVEECRKPAQLEYVGEQRTRGAGGASYRYWRRDGRDKFRVIYGIAVSADRYSTPQGELDIWVRWQTLSQVSGVTEEEIRTTLKRKFSCTDRGKKKTLVRLKSVQEAQQLVALLTQWLDRQVGHAAKGAAGDSE